MDGTTIKAHAEHLRLANTDDWKIPEDATYPHLRKTNYVINPEISESESSSSDSDDNIPLSKITKRYRKERANSSDEGDIPKLELSKRLREKQLRLKAENNENSDSNSDVYNNTTDINSELESNLYNRTTEEEDMSVDHVKIPKHKIKLTRKRSQSRNKTRKLLKTIAGML